MPILNVEVADIFRQVADLLDIEGANPFRVRAYRNAARTVESHPRSMHDMVAADEDLTELPGIGDALADKIREIVNTGSLRKLAEIKEQTPAELTNLLKVTGLGPKRVEQLHEELGIESLDALQMAAKEGKIASLHGFGEKIQTKILQDVQARGDKEETRTRLDIAAQVVSPLVAYLEDHSEVQRVNVAGSYRRRKSTLGDLDLLTISDAGEKVIAHFVDYEDVSDIISQGETRSTVKLRSGMQVDLRVVPEESYGAALLYFTGSKPHNIQLRDMALARGWKVNEYGVFEDQVRIAGESEAEIYACFDLPFIPPELRESRGEIEAAQAGNLPALVTLDDMQGDLQTHTTASDGKATLKEMARAAQALGYDYIAITDHSSYVGVTQGLDAEALAQRIDEIARVNEEFDDLNILAGIEVDILKDGSLDLPDDVLSRVNVCLCAIHTNFDLSREKQTSRILRALDNPNVHIFVHPTGRRIQERPPYDVDLERVMEAALERGCYLEINASPERLDLNDVHARMAKEMGLKLSISTDAHAVNALDTMRFGVDQARRAWLTAEDVLNARSWRALQKLLVR